MHLKMERQLKKLFLYIVIILAFEKSKIYVPENKFVPPYAGTSGINKINHSHANYVIINITQITKTGIFVFIAVLVFKLSRRKVLFINKIYNRNC